MMLDLGGILTCMPSNQGLILIWQAIRVHFYLQPGKLQRISSQSSEGGGSLSQKFMISTLQVVHASCLSHNPYTFIFSFTDLFVASIRLSPILRYILPYLHYSVYYIPFTPLIFIIIFLAYSPILSTLVIFFHILQSIFFNNNYDNSIIRSSMKSSFFFIVCNCHIFKTDPPHLHQIIQSFQQSVIDFLPLHIHPSILIKFQTLWTISSNQQKNNSNLFFCAQLHQVKQVFAFHYVRRLLWLLFLNLLLILCLLLLLQVCFRLLSFCQWFGGFYLFFCRFFLACQILHFDKWQIVPNHFFSLLLKFICQLMYLLHHEILTCSFGLQVLAFSQIKLISSRQSSTYSYFFTAILFLTVLKSIGLVIIVGQSIKLSAFQSTGSRNANESQALLRLPNSCWSFASSSRPIAVLETNATDFYDYIIFQMC